MIQLERNGKKFVIDRLSRCLEHLHAHHVTYFTLDPANVYMFGMKWKLVDFSNSRKSGSIIPPVMPRYPWYVSSRPNFLE